MSHETPENAKAGADSDDSGDTLDVRGLTWAALLGRWTDFARSSLAFPKGAEGDRLRASVAPIVGLQAISFALSEVDDLPADERSLGLDRAGVLIRRHARELRDLWGDEAMPLEIEQVVLDAHSALRLAASQGIELRVAVDRLVMPDLTPQIERALAEGFQGEIHAAAPGTALFRGAPAAFFRPDCPLQIDGCARAPSPPRQVYRQADDSGRPVRDLVALHDDRLQPGRPLLGIVAQEGRLVQRFDAGHAPEWLAAQDAMLQGRTLPVVEKEPDDVDARG